MDFSVPVCGVRHACSPEAKERALIVWKTLRITFLLLALVVVAGRTWLDRVETQSWKTTLWVGIFPLNGDGSQAAQQYIADLSPSDFRDIETFFERESHRYGVPLDEPIHIELYPEGQQLPPQLEDRAGIFGVAWWSLKLRWFASHATNVPGRAPPRIRIFVLYYDPAAVSLAPDSHGLQKGLMGVVHAFALKAVTGNNNLVIAHEVMHTLGATDKYQFGTGAPQYPAGFGDPDRKPLYPQPTAEIMAGRRAISATDFEMPPNLRFVVAGDVTAHEVGWTRH
jgi:hypothetical protein